MDQENWNYFGWEGISFLKPKEWEPSQLESDKKKGYVVFDDGVVCRLQLRWQEAKGEADLDRIVDRQVKKLEKANEDSLQKPKIKDYKTKTLQGKRLRFEIEGIETCYYILQCSQCKRVVLLGVFGAEGEKLGDLGGNIARSLMDHPEGEKVMWAAFGFRFSVPLEFSLENHNLRSGDLRFEFSADKSRVVFHRLSVANVLLKNEKLGNWVETYVTDIYDIVGKLEVAAFEGKHSESVGVEGQVPGRVKFITKKPFYAFFWVCEKENGIYGVSQTGNDEKWRPENMMKEVECH